MAATTIFGQISFVTKKYRHLFLVRDAIARAPDHGRRKPKCMYVDRRNAAEGNFDRVACSATWNENELWPPPPPPQKKKEETSCLRFEGLLPTYADDASPWQNVPFPVKPAMHAHWTEPGVFTQCALPWQPCSSVLHSLMSESSQKFPSIKYSFRGSFLFWFFSLPSNMANQILF